MTSVMNPLLLCKAPGPPCGESSVVTLSLVLKKKLEENEIELH